MSKLCAKSAHNTQDTEAIAATIRRLGWRVYMIVEPLGRRREVHVRERPTAQDWAEEVAHIVEVMYPTVQKITLIQDNLSMHKKAALYECFAPERAWVILSKLEFVFTPKRGSWLNVAEIELSVLTR